MCGIAGIWNRGQQPVERAALREMNAMLAHRGPDADNILVDGSIGFGHRRLSIIDLSDLGNQPMTLDDGRLWMTFNGEIFNYLELRDELQQLGRRFVSDSDSEVLLHSFDEWGTDCFERLNGMWAVAIWCSQQRRLILCRDRFGIKPLYWSIENGRVLFASEAKAILCVAPELREPNLQEVYSFLLNVSPNRNEETFFQRIRSVLPATYVEIGERGEGVAHDYWSFRAGQEHEFPDPEERLRHLLEESVRLRLRSNVPVASCLSGGLDSSSVTRLAARTQREPIPCFSLRYEDRNFDESKYAASTADDPSQYQIHWVEPTSDAMVEKMTRITWHHDAPSPIRGRYVLWEIFGQLSRHAKVALVGEGADELLAGYPHFTFPYLLDRLRSKGLSYFASPASLREALMLNSTVTSRPWRRLIASPIPALKCAMQRTVRRKNDVIDADFARSQGDLDPSGVYDSWLRRDVDRPFRSHLNNALWLEFKSFGLPEILHSGDAISMAFSVEARPPFLDHNLVEFCFSLPYHEKIRDGWTKSLLRRSMSDVLPEDIRWRRDKKGLPAPYKSWMGSRSNVEAFRAILNDPATLQRGVFDRRGLRRLSRELDSQGAYSRRRLRANLLWRVITTELWFRLFIDEPPRAP